MTLLREMPPTEGEAVEDICRALARLVGFGRVGAPNVLGAQGEPVPGKPALRRYAVR